jgi:hypothetical protein
MVTELTDYDTMMDAEPISSSSAENSSISPSAFSNPN